MHENSFFSNTNTEVILLKKKLGQKFGIKSLVEDQPESAGELVNKYGTYNIQPTADTENEFPAIAQGLGKEK